MTNPVDEIRSYDRIGRNYRRHRRPDARIAAQVRAALGDARTVLNVGAGTGCYEPEDLTVTAVEPSIVMIEQRAHVRVAQGAAELLPVRDGAFDVAMASLTVHHWQDWAVGLAEMRRVARRQVLFTFDPEWGGFWLVDDYLPEIVPLDGSRSPTMRDYADHLDVRRVEVVPVPHDCTDGFMAAYWRRPHAYLDAEMRSCISSLEQLPPAIVERAVDALRSDLDSGAWHERHRDLLPRGEMDYGYRLVVAGAA